MFELYETSTPVFTGFSVIDNKVELYYDIDVLMVSQETNEQKVVTNHYIKEIENAN